MTLRSSLFAKIRADVLAVGRSERTAVRKGRLLSSASFSDFVRLTPEQNAKLGLSRKSRHYALKGRTDNQGNANDQCAPIRDEARQRAVRPHFLRGRPKQGGTAPFHMFPPTSASASPKLRLESSMSCTP